METPHTTPAHRPPAAAQARRNQARRLPIAYLGRALRHGRRHRQNRATQRWHLRLARRAARFALLAAGVPVYAAVAFVVHFLWLADLRWASAGLVACLILSTLNPIKMP